MIKMIKNKIILIVIILLAISYAHKCGYRGELPEELTTPSKEY